MLMFAVEIPSKFVLAAGTTQVTSVVYLKRVNKSINKLKIDIFVLSHEKANVYS